MPILPEHRRAFVEERFRHLLELHCFGIATREEEKKLERYQRLRRELNGTAYTTPAQARREWKDKQMWRALRCFVLKSEGEKYADPT